MKKSMIIAHRGASAYAPENTMSSFKKALDMKAGGIEIDVHLTKDNHLVVIHDEKLNRTSDGSGLVKDHTLKQIKEYDFGSWFSPEFINERIPTLDETMELLKKEDLLLNIEIKYGSSFYPGIAKAVVDAVINKGMAEKVIVSSFDHYTLKEVKMLEPKMKIGLLYSGCLYNPADYARTLDAEAIHPHYAGINTQSIKNCKENGVLINAWTINEPEHIKLAILSGIDGIITNYPDRAKEILEKL